MTGPVTTDRSVLRGADVREALKDEVPVRRLVSVCGWCPDHVEQTANARANGFDVSHGLCAPCAARMMRAVELLETKCQN